MLTPTLQFLLSTSWIPGGSFVYITVMGIITITVIIRRAALGRSQVEA